MYKFKVAWVCRGLTSDVVNGTHFVLSFVLCRRHLAMCSLKVQQPPQHHLRKLVKESKGKLS